MDSLHVQHFPARVKPQRTCTSKKLAYMQSLGLEPKLVLPTWWAEALPMQLQKA